MNPGNLLVVMWHYIVPPKGIVEVGGVRIAGERCSFERFRKQLETLKKSFNIISLADLLAGRIPEKAVILTFDDGLRNQFELAFPILQEVGLPAIFSVMGDPFVFTIPATFKLQLIGGRGSGIDIDDLREDIFPAVLKNHGLEQCLENIHVPEKSYRAEPPQLREIKHICNKVLDPNDKNVVVNEMFHLIFPDREEDLCQKMFMGASTIRHLKKNGMEIASHGFSHHFLSTLNDEQIWQELKGSRNVLHNVLGWQIPAFVYPSSFSGDERIEGIVKTAGYQIAFAYNGEPALNFSPFNPFCVHRIHEADFEKFL